MTVDHYLGAITDREGVRYPLNCHINDALHCFEVSCGGAVVARAQCWLADNKELQLNDLQVVDSTLIPWLNLRLLGYLGLVHRRSFRRKGLATSLLNAIVQWSRQRGLASITGMVVAADLAAFPGLAEMYRRYGFEVTKGSGNVSYVIEMRL